MKHQALFSENGLLLKEKICSQILFFMCSPYFGSGNTDNVSRVLKGVRKTISIIARHSKHTHWQTVKIQMKRLITGNSIHSVCHSVFECEPAPILRKRICLKSKTRKINSENQITPGWTTYKNTLT